MTFALPYQGVFMEAVEIIPFHVYAKKAGKVIEASEVVDVIKAAEVPNAREITQCCFFIF